MSGRRLGRLLGSLLTLAVIVGVDILSTSGSFQLTDVIWGAGTFR